MRIALIADTHLSARSPECVANWHAARRAVGRLGADLTVNLGWKGFSVSNEATAVIKASFPEGKITAEDWFQPHVGLAYGLGGRAEVFAGFSQATRAFASATTASSAPEGSARSTTSTRRAPTRATRPAMSPS